MSHPRPLLQVHKRFLLWVSTISEQLGWGKKKEKEREKAGGIPAADCAEAARACAVWAVASPPPVTFLSSSS